MEDRLIQLQTNLNKFINHVDDLTNEEDPAGNGFHREYRDLREKAAQDKEKKTFPAEYGREPFNMKKNRYKDIIAFDYSRVILQETGVDGSDYINANLIQDPYNNDGYIATQGPLPHTVDDFWRMIMEKKVKVVIMACKLVEGNKKKCAVYWPETVGEEESYGNVTVKMTNESDMKEDCTVRVFEASYGDQFHKVTQYHYTGWPDHGIPEDREVILTMIANMRDIRENDPAKAPILVHCSAGCGRTGTVCAIDYAWGILKGGKLTRDFSMYNIVETMRTERQSMIQTPDQYEMAHLAVRDLFQKHLEIMEENIYMNVGGIDEEQDALDSLNMVTQDDDFEDEDTYSFASATKVLQDSVQDTVNSYTNEEEISDSVSQPTDKPSPKKPSVPITNKPALPTDKPPLPSKNYHATPDNETKPVIKNKYQNVAMAGAPYENFDLVTVEEKQESSFLPKSTPPGDRKFSPKTAKKLSPPSSPFEKKASGPIFTDEKTDTPVLTGKKKDSPVSTKKMTERPVVTDTSGSSVYSMAGPASSGPMFATSGHVPKQSGLIWSSAQPNAETKPVSTEPPKLPKAETKPISTEPTSAKLPKEDKLIPQSVQSVKTTSVPSAETKAPTISNGKHVTKITVGGSKTPTPKNKTVTEPNNNLYSVASNPRDQKQSGPQFSANTGGDVYSLVQKDKKTSSPLRSSQGPSKPSRASQQDVYSQVSHTPEAVFQGHILGGDGSYSDVVLGQPAKVEDSVYSYVSVDPSSPQDSAPPDIPNRGYIDPPREPPPRGPAQTDTHGMTLNKGSTLDQNRFKGLITKIKGGTSEHQYTDTSNIKGFHERIGQKPMGKKEEPSGWKKMFKSK
ncbi:tyrosine-protein phosphatase non-receptor type 12-like isoform X2 [Pecten maximus]|uniref:tyrosine-protein phosphatase non-receptor type 12-like isoform X2 n=1 Tax=Pecten maximus TaxID=6579 RepID=UPI001458FE70|nr:tyrosine-protein phosphatase non-receptor type 12-like isoform X2 [Pecten maximus]